MTGDRIEVFQDKNQQWRWHRRAANNEIVADSGEGYLHRRDAYEMAVSLFPGLQVVDLPQPNYIPPPDVDDDAD